MRKKTTAEFIREARQKHGRKYDYSLVGYKDAKTKIVIICRKHGAFPQTPDNHLLGKGCQKCGAANRADAKRDDRETFITKARQKHGDKYDYSLVQYTDATTKVIIICPQHGVFPQRPNGHLSGKGCKKCATADCAENRKKTQSNFIREARLVHGRQYGYSLVEYSDYHTDVIIICKTHGAFPQTPAAHLAGRGCRKCGRVVAADKQRGICRKIFHNGKERIGFIEAAMMVHGDRYDYSLVEYVNSDTNVIIICSVHGGFPQRPNAHLTGAGCKKCATIRNANSQRKDNTDFIRDAKEKHGNKYDYSLAKYSGAFCPVTIICKTHGAFPQTPDAHINQGQNCPQCSRMWGADKIRKDREQFIVDARKVHGDKYDYSLVAYHNTHTEITIVCPVHGEFPQTPNHHLHGTGCPECYDDEKTGWNDCDDFAGGMEVLKGQKK